jgi:hypothetical protein
MHQDGDVTRDWNCFGNNGVHHGTLMIAAIHEPRDQEDEEQPAERVTAGR